MDITTVSFMDVVEIQRQNALEKMAITTMAGIW